MALLAEPPQNPLYAHVLSELERLGRAHLLVHDLAVGQFLLQQFWGGDARAFHSQDPTKQLSFAKFAEECSESLAHLGQSADRLNRCVRAHLVYRTLPQVLQGQLLLSHLLELGRCADPTLRTRLALVAVQEGWSLPTLRDAVRRANAGRWYDADPATPGTQPPGKRVVKSRGKGSQALSAPRLVSHGERLVPGLGAWVQRLGAADLARLDDGQRERLGAVLAQLQRELEALQLAVARQNAPL